MIDVGGHCSRDFPSRLVSLALTQLIALISPNEASDVYYSNLVIQSSKYAQEVDQHLIITGLIPHVLLMLILVTARNMPRRKTLNHNPTYLEI